MSGRVTRIALFFFFMLSLLGLRLGVLMLLPDAAVKHSSGHKTRIQAELEHLHVLRVDDGRGRVLYRNGLPWSGTVRSSAASLSGDSAAAKHEKTSHLVVHSESTSPSAGHSLIVGKVGLPDVWPSPVRSVAEQGRSGLEYTFDFLLRQGHPGYLGLMEGVEELEWSRRLFWLPVKPGIDIRTTIDPVWQKTAESALDRHGIKTGAVVVLNVKNRDILAMASRNVLSPGTNEAVKAHAPGSIFKIITAAAALNSYRNSPQDNFYCDGHLNQPGITLKCWRKHGHETLLQALAGSCNVAFAQLGINAGEKALAWTAQSFGLSGTGLQHIHGKSVLPEAEPAHVFIGTKHTPADRGAIAHTAIGQQDVRLSPVQAANLAATVAAGGVYQDARLVTDAERNHKPKRYFGGLTKREAVSQGTAAWIGKAMYMTSHWPQGTAFDLADSKAAPAVKTGTAEVTGGKVNAWIVGYAPYRHPDIAFCVFVGPDAGQAAHQQVHAVTKDLLASYRQFQKGHVIG